jgi:hypothetical protein
MKKYKIVKMENLKNNFLKEDKELLADKKKLEMKMVLKNKVLLDKVRIRIIQKMKK